MINIGSVLVFSVAKEQVCFVKYGLLSNTKMLIVIQNKITVRIGLVLLEREKSFWIFINVSVI